jgi:hypothetical protein
MEKARPSERRVALHQCARDVGLLYRLRQLNRREASQWASALQLWGERRAGLTWAATANEIVKGLTEETASPSNALADGSAGSDRIHMESMK